MKKIWFAGAVLALANSAVLAQEARPVGQQIERPGQVQQILDPFSFCYHENWAYSEGAVIGGLQCQRDKSAPARTITLPNGGQVSLQPLVWHDPKSFYMR